MNIDDIIENAQLKGRVIALDAEVKCLEAVIRAHERVDCLSVISLKKQLVEAEAENARLKAFSDEAQAHIAKEERKSCERLEMEQAENARLKAEVADLKSTADRFKAEVERVGAENSHLHKGIYSLSLNVGQLKDEVETLRKLGTEMGKHLPDTDAANRAYIDFEAGGKS
jgi:predicted nuclease with TOPRIM domain